MVRQCALIAYLLAHAILTGGIALAQEPCQVQKLIGQGMGGAAVAIERDWAFVNWRAFERREGAWHRGQVINSAADALALGGDVVVAGSPNADHSGFRDAGVVEIYERQPGGFWVETQRLTASDPGTGERFGIAISFNGDRIAIGADGWIPPVGPGNGKAYVFEKVGGRWVETHRLTDPFFRGSRFGQGIAIDGDRLVVGAPGLDTGGEDTGIAHIFDFDGEEWRYSASVDQFRAVFPYAEFGYPIVLQGDRLVIGATNWAAPNEDWPGTGNLYYYERRDGNWRLIDDMNGFLGNDGDRLGSGIALVGNVIYAGRPGDDLEDGEDSGSVEIIDIIDDFLIPRTRFRPVDPDDDRWGDGFGYALDVDGDSIIVGAPYDDEGATNAGAAFVFSLSGCFEAAILTDIRMLDGVMISGGLEQLVDSDDQYLETEARVTGEVHQPHLLRLRIGAVTEVDAPSAFDLTIEGRITDVEAQTTLYLRDWDNNQFVQVDQYEMTFSEDTHTATIEDAARFVRDSDGRIELEIKQIVFLPFTLNGFHTLFDQVELAVR